MYAFDTYSITHFVWPSILPCTLPLAQQLEQSVDFTSFNSSNAPLLGRVI